MHGADLREGETGTKAQPLGRLIDGDEEIEIAAFAEDDERL
jgi:hypothetical protein